MKSYLLVLNAGSSSIKFAVYQSDGNKRLVENCAGHIEGIGTSPRFRVMHANGERLVDQLPVNSGNLDHKESLELIMAWLMDYLGKNQLLVVGHRVVHGGVDYAAPILIDADVLADLEKLIPLAPLHQPHNLAAIRTLQELIPNLPQVGCFDTAFHQNQPEIAQYTGLPERFFHAGIRRYGFHGLSFEYISSVLPSFSPELANARVIIAHLGNGASLCAVQDSRSIATTMGFSPLDGLLMGTRCGCLDPGVLLYLMRNNGMNPDELEHLLYHESGLLGISSISADMRMLLASDKSSAKKAIDLFVYRIQREIGSLMAALGGLDALVFTGGIGENSPEIREMIGLQAAWLGLEIDQQRNKNSTAFISSQASKVSVMVIPTNESLMIAQHTLALIN